MFLSAYPIYYTLSSLRYIQQVYVVELQLNQITECIIQCHYQLCPADSHIERKYRNIKIELTSISIMVVMRVVFCTKSGLFSARIRLIMSLPRVKERSFVHAFNIAKVNVNEQIDPSISV